MNEKNAEIERFNNMFSLKKRNKVMKKQRSKSSLFFNACLDSINKA